MDEMTQGQMARMVSGCTKRAAPEPRFAVGKRVIDGEDEWYIISGRRLVTDEGPAYWVYEFALESGGKMQALPEEELRPAPEPPSPALVNEDGRGEYPVAEAWRGYAEAAEERAQEAERKLAAATEAHRALVEAARQVHDMHNSQFSTLWNKHVATVWLEDMWALGAALKALAALEAQEGERHE